MIYGLVCTMVLVFILMLNSALFVVMTFVIILFSVFLMLLKLAMVIIR